MTRARGRREEARVRSRLWTALDFTFTTLDLRDDSQSFRSARASREDRWAGGERRAPGEGIRDRRFFSLSLPRVRFCFRSPAVSITPRVPVIDAVQVRSTKAREERLAAGRGEIRV